MIAQLCAPPQASQPGPQSSGLRQRNEPYIGLLLGRQPQSLIGDHLVIHQMLFYHLLRSLPWAKEWLCKYDSDTISALSLAEEAEI